MIKKIIVTLRDELVYQLKLIQHKGSKFECPFCGYKSNDHEKIGKNFPVLIEKMVVGGGERYAGCYKCGSTDRERLIFAYFKEKTDFLKTPEQYSILHIAPEKNLSKMLIKEPFKEYICGDLFTEGYIYPQHVINMDLLRLPFSDNHFDIVICNHVLEHIEVDTQAINEIHRVLNKSGKAILQVPISTNTEKTYEDFTIKTPSEREKRFGQFDHVRIYGQDYKNRLEKCGFIVEQKNISSEFEKYGLNENEILYISTKQ